MTSPVTDDAKKDNDDTQYQIYKKDGIPFDGHQHSSHHCSDYPVYRFYDYHRWRLLKKSLSKKGMAADYFLIRT